MLETLANYVVAKKRGRGGRLYESARIYLPTKLTCDSAFPLKEDLVPVCVRIEGRRLVIERASKRALCRFGPPRLASRRRRRGGRSLQKTGGRRG